jgi:hypothetical protein
VWREMPKYFAASCWLIPPSQAMRT